MTTPASGAAGQAAAGGQGAAGRTSAGAGARGDGPAGIGGSRPLGRPGPRRLAGRRLVGAALGLVLLGLLVGPLAVLVHDRWAPLLSLDASTSRAAERLVEAHPGVLTAARLVTHLGDPAVVTAGSLLTLVVLLARGARRLALYVLLVRLGALLLSTTVKVAVARARPVFDLPVATAFGYSFPSGHALGGSAFWLSTAVVVLPLVRSRLRPWLLAGAVLIAVLVAASRVLLGVHYLSDVAAGLVLGFGWTVLCTYVFALWRREEGRPVAPYEDGLHPELGA